MIKVDEMPFIREMSKTLCDKGINPLYSEDTEIIAALLCAGWLTSTIERNFNPVKTMTTIRLSNDIRKGKLT